MSISFGAYEPFSYAIPGILYLYIANEFLKLFGLYHVEYQAIDNFFSIVLVIIVGYVLAQILESPAKKWRRWRQITQGPVTSIENLNKQYPNAKIKFLPQDWFFLYYGLIRRYHPGSADIIERVGAISIMLQNISFALLFCVFYFLTVFFIGGYYIMNLILALSVLIAAISVKRKSQMYNQWFYDSIFDISLSFGSTAEKIIRKTQASKPTGID